MATLRSVPSRAVSGARSKPVHSTLILLALVLIVATLRRGELPNMHAVGVYAIAALVIVLSTQFAPDFVTTLLFVALIVVVLGNAELVTGAIERGFSAFASQVDAGRA